LTSDGQFAQILGMTEIQVNSLHWQGIDRLAPGLTAEGTAPDGTIEAVRVTAARNFALGVQWHPEFRAAENPVSLALFQAFGKAAQAHARAKQGHRAFQAA
jgi:putative glutamine amidotransferase